MERCPTGFVFEWTDVGASAYKLWLGTTTGGEEYGEFPGPGGTAATAMTIPLAPGQLPTHVRLWSLVSGVWYSRDYTFK